MPTIDPTLDHLPDDAYAGHRRYARLLGQAAQRLLDHLKRPPATRAELPLSVLWTDTDADDPFEVWNALLEGAAALTFNQRLRERLGELASEHTVTAVTASHFWNLIALACRALHHHPDLSEEDRELLRAAEQAGDLGECDMVTLLPEVGLALVNELLHARKVIGALDGLEDDLEDDLERVKASMPPPDQARTPHQQQIDAALRALQQARDAYREVVARDAARGLPTQLPTGTPAPDEDEDEDEGGDR